MHGKNIISSLIGLTGAVSNNGKKEDTDAVVLKALLNISSENPDEDAGMEEQEKIIEAKFRISPDCRVCKKPCGNTSDYDMEKFDRCPEEIKAVKLGIIDALHEYALSHQDAAEVPDEVYRGIAYLGFVMSLEQYEEVLEDLKKLV